MKKIKILLAIVLIIGAAALYDLYRCTTVNISVEQVNPEPAPADPSSPVEMCIKITDKHGNPIEGHNIYALSQSGGSFKSYREKSDKNGMTVFEYYPNQILSYQSLKDAALIFRDESNSVFIEMYPSCTYNLELTRAGENGQSGNIITSDDIFG